LVMQTREQYLAAARCPGVESPLYHDLGVMLTQEADLLAANPTERRVILQEAINSLNAGLNLASFNGERARIERDLGAALVLLGKASQGLANQHALYKQAVEKFESGTKVGNEAKTARIFGLWGVALLELGKADNDRMLMRQAVERLQTAIELDTANVESRYNLARAYALLDQPEPGMRHLKICLDHDPDRAYYNTAMKDPDLDNLRRTAEYNQLFDDESSMDPQTIIRTQISDH
jgi:tetratricopeptide (TPR) repeat protein